jgi:hypothetical protein
MARAADSPRKLRCDFPAPVPFLFPNPGGKSEPSHLLANLTDPAGSMLVQVQGWIVIGLLVLIMLGIVGLGAEIKTLPYLWRTSAEEIR